MDSKNVEPYNEKIYWMVIYKNNCIVIKHRGGDQQIIYLRIGQIPTQEQGVETV